MKSRNPRLTFLLTKTKQTQPHWNLIAQQNQPHLTQAITSLPNQVQSNQIENEESDAW